MSIASPKGVFDLLDGAPERWKDPLIWQHVEGTCRQLAQRYGFAEVRTPAFERTELFTRSVGEATDIVAKEMYTFEDKAGRLLTLRPEGTAPVIRALLSAGRQQAGFQKYFYLGPMWRYERQQAGRYRQHHQFGVEIIGDPSPERDAELVDLLLSLFQALGLKDLSLVINSIGDRACRETYRKALCDFLKPKLSTLSEDSQRRFETNPLRILDSKNPNDQAALEGAPSVLEYLSKECHSHFIHVQHSLEALGISFSIEPRLVRGLDYYTRTVFEITAQELGAQNSLGGGGRYDELIQDLGGPSLPALGFGAGLERIIQTMIAQKVSLPRQPALLLLVPLGEQARKRCFVLLKKLREAGIACEIDLLDRKLKAALKSADARSISHVAIIGDDEIAKDTCELKEMATRSSQTVPIQELANHV